MSFTASCTAKSSVSYSPQLKMTVVAENNGLDKVTCNWKLQYYAYSAANTSKKRTYSARLGGSEVVSGSYSIDGKKGWYTIASGKKTITRGHESKTVYFSCKMDLDITWSGTKINTISKENNFSLKAKPSYTVKYNTNGGSGTFNSQTKWHNEDIKVRSGSPTKTGYTFKYWQRDGSTVTYKPETTIEYNGNQTLVAQWQPRTYTITYNANASGASVENMPSSQTKTYGKELTLSSKIPTRAKYMFKGWSRSSSGGSLIQPNSKFNDNSNTTLYAIWELSDTYKPPRISNFSIVRCDSSGKETSLGAYCKVHFDWSTSANIVSNGITIEAFALNSSIAVVTEHPAAFGTTGTVDHLFGGNQLQKDKSYTIRATVRDSRDGNSQEKMLRPMEFVLDFLKGGKGIAVGKPAEQAGFDVAMTMYLDGYVMNISPATVRAYESIGMGASQSPMGDIQLDETPVDTTTEQETQTTIIETTESVGDI